jgi:hypothetical protein
MTVKEPPEKPRLVQMYDRGMTLRQVAAEFSVSYTVARKWFMALGIPIRPKSYYARQRSAETMRKPVIIRQANARNRHETHPPCKLCGTKRTETKYWFTDGCCQRCAYYMRQCFGDLDIAQLMWAICEMKRTIRVRT